MRKQTTLKHSIADTENVVLTWVIRTYQPLITATVQKYHLHTYDQDDLYQEAHLVCYKTLKHYDPKNSSVATYGTYLKHSLNNHFCSLLRKQQAQKRKINLECISFDKIGEFYSMITNQLIDLSNLPSDYLLLTETFDEALAACSTLERSIMKKLLLHHLDIQTTAKHLALPENTVRCAYFRCRRKLKNALKKINMT